MIDSKINCDKCKNNISGLKKIFAVTVVDYRNTYDLCRKCYVLFLKFIEVRT